MRKPPLNDLTDHEPNTFCSRGVEEEEDRRRLNDAEGGGDGDLGSTEYKARIAGGPSEG